MRFISAPMIDDRAILSKLCANVNLMGSSGVPALEARILAEYKSYLNVRGCESSLTQIGVTADQKQRLLSLYSQEVVGLEFIPLIRNELSAGCCPMCGKPGTHTVEHFIEKDNWPQFAIFSKNLVPACSCNPRRVQCVVGGAPVKPIHPYFDKIGRRKLMRASFSGDFFAPAIDVVPCRSLREYRARVSAHIEAVVKRNQIVGFLRQRWEVLVEAPAKALGFNHGDVANISFSELRLKLKQLEGQEAHNSKSNNNWMSVFYAGVAANPHAVDGILRRLGKQPVGGIRNL